jgi:hypothetical protein
MKNKLIELLETVVEQNKEIIDLLKKDKNKNLKPYQKLIDKKDHSKHNHSQESFPKPWGTNTPIARDTLICMHCGNDTGIPMVLNMVIPPEGLPCRYCKKVVVLGSAVTC